MVVYYQIAGKKVGSHVVSSHHTPRDLIPFASRDCERMLIGSSFPSL
jgi:hypothetical protein